MPAKENKSSDYKPLNGSGKNAGNGSPAKGDQPALTAGMNRRAENSVSAKLTNSKNSTVKEIPLETVSEKAEIVSTEFSVSQESDAPFDEASSYSEQVKLAKTKKRAEKDRELLSSDRWIERNGHTLTYAGLYFFSVLVLFRPYELIPGLGFLSTSAFIFALATLLIYIPTQLASESSLTILSTEVKCILALTLLALVTMPIAKDPPTAWATFNDTFIKAVLMFIVMVNVLRTRRRLMGLMWLSLSIGIYLSYIALDLYMRGEMKVEGYRVDVEVKGLFGNPNDLALHLVTMIPIAIALGFASRAKLARIAYFIIAALLIAATTITFSRGGFLGLIACLSVLAWKLGRKNRAKVTIISLVSGVLFVLLAPGNYGVRILSIFGLAQDPNGSRDQRRELLIRSIEVTLRNPWGIGIGNFPIVGIHNLVTHNAFTQISSEIGLLGLAAYLIFLISPFRKLGAIERTLYAKDEHDWFYYMAIGLQASIIGYMVSSFFVAVAYNWFVYYLIGYAVAFRRIYKYDKKIEETETDVFGWQTI